MPRERSIDPRLLDTLDWGDGGPDERHGQLVEAIDRLPEKHRLVVNAVFWERVSKRSLARQLGISRNEVERRLAKAFALLREELEDG